MSIPEQIRALETLANVDAELKLLDEQLTLERGALNALKGNIKRLDEKLELDRGQLGATEKSRNELVTDVRNMTTQLEHSRDKLGRSRTEREANAAQRELEELRKLLRDREDEITKLTSDGDSARGQIEATEQEQRKLTDELNAREGDINSKVGAFEAQRKTKQADRDVAAKRLPPVLYRRYEMIRLKRGFAIAQTSDGTCKACNMSLPPQLFHRLRREPMLEQCPSCHRIIYFVSPAPAASTGGR